MDTYCVISENNIKIGFKVIVTKVEISIIAILILILIVYWSFY